MKRGRPWYTYDPQEVAAETIGANEEERLSFFDTLQKALLKQERGVNPYADILLDERAAMLEASSAGGKKGASNRWPDKDPLNTPCTPPVIPPNTPSTPETEPKPEPYQHLSSETETEPKAPPAAFAPAQTVVTADATGFRTSGLKEGGDGEATGNELLARLGIGTNAPTTKRKAVDPIRKAMQNPKEGVYAVDAVLLPRFMAEYCGQGKDPYTLNTFDKAQRKLGNGDFRELAGQFVAECETGEEPRNRGAAFTARLKKAGLVA